MFMELQPLDYRLFTPDKLELPTYLLNEDEAFCQKKTERTYWIRILFQDRVYTIECKKNLNKASSLADKIRSTFGKDPIWIACRIRLTSGELPVYIKRQQGFLPRHMHPYDLEPKFIIEGSGKDTIEPSIMEKMYAVFAAHIRETDPRRATVVSKRSHPFLENCRLLLWSERSFVVDTQKELGSGTSKKACYAIKVDVVNYHHFIASKRVLLMPKKIDSRVDFELANLGSLSHPNLGVEEKNIRYVH